MEDEKKRKVRTASQNRSLHKWCKELSDELNSVGVPMEVFVRDIQADYTMEAVKEVFRAFGRAKYGKGHTSDLTTVEMQEVYKEMSRHVAQFGIEMAWPSYEDTDNYIKSLDESR